MGRTNTSLVVLFASVVGLAFFQNCSQASFTAASNSAQGGQSLRVIQPALAVRASGCVGCHAQVTSPFITDLGFGNNWFVGLNQPVNYADASQVLSFKNGNIYGDHADNWSSGQMSGPIVVPETPAAPIGANGAMKTLAEYFTGLENAKTNPTVVREAKSVYIGAPTVAQLEAAFSVHSGTPLKYMPADTNSPALSGIQWQSAGYFMNTGPVMCDGDLFLRGTVFLNKPTIWTRNGCRIYSTGPIFMQENPSYENMSGAVGANNTNLQLVSARAIILGVGTTHCETASTVGLRWYFDHNYSNPLQHRLKDIWTVNSHVTRSNQNPRAEGDLLMAEAQKLGPQYKDASCYSGGRGVSLNRVLLNAPLVHSRLTGGVSGVVITEVALFSLSQFSYSFDQVFLHVPVLPILPESQFLMVQ